MLARTQIQPDGSAWMLRLVEATSPHALAQQVEAFARTLTDAQQVVLLWLDSDRLLCGNDLELLDLTELGAATEFLLGAGLVQARGSTLFLRVPPSALLLLRCAGERPPRGAEDLADFLPLIGAHLKQALKFASLQRAHRQLPRSEVLQRALFAISDLAGSTLDMGEMLERIHGIVGTLMYAANFFIVRHDPVRQTLRFLYFSDVVDADNPIGEDIPLAACEGTLTWHLLVTGQPIMGSMEQIQAMLPDTFRRKGPISRDWLGVPMLSEGQVHGALVVQSYEEGIRYTDEDRTLLEFVGSHILTALARKERKDELEAQVRQRTLELAQANRGLQQEIVERERAERLQASLFHIAQLATVDIDEETFYKRMHEAVGELINADNFFIGLLSGDKGLLDFPYYVDAGERRQVSREVGRGLSEYVMRTGRPLLGSRSELDQLGMRGEIEVGRFGRPSLCWLGVPLRVGDDVIGVVVVQSYSEESAYGPVERDLLGFVATQIATSIQRRRAAMALQQANTDLERRVLERTHELREQIARRESMQKQLEHQVMHDTLTGLPNRRALRERLEFVLERERNDPDGAFALLYLDVDRFKVINDSLGHLAGDSFLKEISNRLRSCAGSADLVSRLSGDEFAVLLDDARTAASAAAFAARLLAALNRPVHLAGRDIEPSVSIGIAVGDPRHETPEDILREADLALYRAKEFGRNRYVVFDDTLARNMMDVLLLEAELRHGLQRGEFEPYFQPVQRLDGGRIVGYEALLRWNHPDRGVLEPILFVKAAQEAGLMEAIDWQLFERACRTMAGHSDPHTFVTVNVAAQHLRHDDFDERLLAMLERSGLAPGRLIVEVTEGSLLDDPICVHATLERLRAFGVGAALDDFGTGYSSLSYLHSLPLRMIKIDRSFVVSLNDNQITAHSIVGAILALSRALGIEVIAEGIESERQHAALRAMGCEFGQGFLLGRPAPLPGAL